MPFTLSHPAAIVPLRHLHLPVAALAIGSMVPDLPLFVRGWWSYPFSHSLIGIVTVDLAVGLVLTALWWTVLRAPFVDSLPAWVRDRMPARPSGWTSFLLAVPAVVVGGLTHTGWDEFTHEGRWGERHLPWLAARHLGVGGVHWAQGVSSVLGIAVVLVVIARTLQRAIVCTPTVRVGGFAIVAWGCVVVAGLVAAVAAAATSTGGLHGAAYAAVTTAVPIAGVCAALAAIAWWGLQSGLSRRARD